MKVALVHEWLTNVAGAERVLLQLKEIYPDAPIFTSVFDQEKAKPFARFDVRTSFLQKVPLTKSRREALIPLAPLAFEQFDLSKFDLVISSTTMAAKGVLTKPETIHISYCHTPPRYLWEPHLDPRAKGGKLAWLKSQTSHNLRIWDRVAADRVDYFLANSHYVASRIKKYYDRDAMVVYPPVSVGRFSIAKQKDIKDYFLFASRLVSYKRCDLVVDAFNDLGLPLKIIGQGPEKDRLKRKAKSNIEFLGFLSDEEIVQYFSEAKAFVFAAEEDFGIVMVEALASGRPVIAYGAGGAAEIVRDGKDGKLYPEQTPQCLIETVKNFDMNKYEPSVIREQAKRFTDERFKTELESVISGIVRRHK